MSLEWNYQKEIYVEHRNTASRPAVLIKVTLAPGNELQHNTSSANRTAYTKQKAPRPQNSYLQSRYIHRSRRGIMRTDSVCICKGAW